MNGLGSLTPVQNPTKKKLWTVVIVGVVAASLFTGYLLVFHTTCDRAAVTQETLLTPLLLLNSPYSPSGTASATGIAERLGEINGQSFPLAAGSLTLSNGAAGGYFIMDVWEIYKPYNSTTYGIGPNQSCTSSGYTALSVEFSPYTYYVQLLPQNSTSDLNEPCEVPYDAFHTPSVLFFNGPPNATSSPYCQYTTNQSLNNFSNNATSPLGLGQSGDGFPVTVPFTVHGRTSYAFGYVPDYYSYSYQLPPIGSWNTYITPSGGLAFEWE
nr:hypothetical protein [Ferrimicrobium acidiphilum]